MKTAGVAGAIWKSNEGEHSLPLSEKNPMASRMSRYSRRPITKGYPSTHPLRPARLILSAVAMGATASFFFLFLFAVFGVLAELPDNLRNFPETVIHHAE